VRQPLTVWLGGCEMTDYKVKIRGAGTQGFLVREKRGE
jgi:hypothetical protein